MSPSFTDRLSALFNLKPGEGRLVTLMILYSAFIGVALDYFYIASSATFLENFTAADFPFVILGAGFAMIFTRVIYSAAERRARQSVLLTGTLLFAIALVLAVRLALTVIDAAWFAFTLLMWMPVINRLIFWGYWGLANRLFSLEQGKRLFSLIAGGLVIASISGTFTVPLVTAQFGTINMYFVAAAAILGAMLVTRVIQRQYRDQLQSSDKPTQTHDDDTASAEKQTLNPLQHRYILLLLVLFILTRGGNYVVDYTLFDRLDARFLGDKDAIANFMGVAFGVTAVFQMLFRFFFAGRIMTRYGMRVGLLTLPTVFLLSNLGTLIVGLTLGDAAALFFWLVIFTKYGEETLREGINDSATRVLYQPLPARLRASALFLVEGNGSPITALLAGGLLSFFALTGTFTPLTGPAIMLLIGIGWLTVALLTYREYVATLRVSVEQRTLSSDVLRDEDASTVDFLRQKLHSENPGEVIYAMDLLEQLSTSQGITAYIVPELDTLLKHPSRLVRQEALRRIEAFKPPMNPMLLLAILRWEKNIHVKEYALRALIAIDEESGFDRLTSAMQSNERPVRRGAMVGLLRHGGIEGVLAAGHELIRLNQSDSPEDRQLGAEVLGEVGIRNFYQPVIPLLRDSNSEVRAAALEAAGKIKHPALWEHILAALRVPGSRPAARRALINVGAEAMPLLSEYTVRLATEIQLPLKSNQDRITQTDPQASTREQLIQVVRIIGRIDDPRTETLLTRYIDFPEPRVRSEILRTLSLKRYQTNDIIRIEKRLELEAAEATWLLAAVHDIGSDARVYLLSDSLIHELHYVRERLFFLLSFLFDHHTVMSAYHAYLYGSSTQRDYALELVDTLLPQEYKRLVIPLLSENPLQQQLQRMGSVFPQARMSRDERLTQIFDEINDPNEAHLPTWIKAAAIYTAGRLGMRYAYKSLKYALSSNEVILRETALQVLPIIERGGYLEAPDKREGDKMLSTIEKIITLQTAPLFTNIPNDILAQVATITRELEVATGEAIITKGEMGTSMYVVVSGFVRVHDGDRTLNLLETGSVFGEMALLDPEPRTASVTAVNDTRLFRLDQAPFFELMADHAEIMRGIVRVLTSNLRERANDVLELRRRIEEIEKPTSLD